MSNRRKFIKKALLGSAGLMLFPYASKLYASNKLIKLTILHTNDMHCHIDPFPETDSRNGGKGGMARLANLIAQERALNPNTLLFDAGDMFQGTPYFNQYKGELVLKVMSKIGYDAGTIGNHEFDNGLQGLKNAIPNADFPIISSNYDFSNTILNGAFPKYQLFEKSGIRIGVYALGIKLKGLVSDGNYGDTQFIDPITIAKEMELFLKKDKKCDLVICLSHLGMKHDDDKTTDVELASKTKYTDLIIGGHTHTFMKEAKVMENAEGNQILINQVGFGALYLGKIDLIFDSSEKTKITFSKNQSNS